ncbi:MAG: SDR family NAD(P)-dependent oxidoreductase, partial [Oscillospiraceae bacterium]
EKARAQFDVNVFGAAAVMREVLPYMRKRRAGIIINMSSVAGRMSVPFGSWYSASKHALEALSDSVRMEVKPFNIKVYTIEPGMMATGFFDVAKREMEESKIPQDYTTSFESFTKRMTFYYKLAPSPRCTVNKIAQCARGITKAARHPVGIDSKMGVATASMLSDRLNDFLYMKLFGVKY